MDDLDKITGKDIQRRYKVNVLREIQNGRVGLSSDIEFIKREEKKAESAEKNKVIDKDITGIPDRYKVRRHYTVSAKAVAQRHNAGKSPKPANREKLKGNKNAWKHGHHVSNFIQARLRPCLTTCPDYPCSLIVENKTKAGEICLDKESIVRLYYDLKKASESKDLSTVNEFAHLMLAESMHLVKTMMEDIIEDGNTLIEHRLDKDGAIVGKVYKPHHLYGVLDKLMSNLGLSLNEFMLTPQAVEKSKDKDKENETLADFTSKLLKSMAPVSEKK
jgi:hypothetical protein